MDLQLAVAASMLPASKGPVAAAFKDLVAGDPASQPQELLDRLWDAIRKREPLSPDEKDDILAAADTAVREARRLGIEPVPLFDPRYPPLLSAIVDPPPVLWMRGRPDALDGRAVAVIGSRAASPYALEVGARLGADLAARGVAVVSGLARGVDSAAHRGALDAGGVTVAVQGCGLDRVYPSEHEDLAARIAESGLLVSELAPGAPPLPEHFPLRNRIISGLSSATVVVEASEASGSLITARCALEQGRDVMAVPGNVLSGRNRGSHALLKDGARMVEGVDDILHELGWAPAAAAGPASAEGGLLGQMTPGEPYDLDQLARALRTDARGLLATLTELELSGRILIVGGRYVRKG